MTRLRGGQQTSDPRLDRVVEFDHRSRAYPVRALLTPEQQAKPRGYTWRCLERLDQGNEGACVGFAWTHELAARPAVIGGLYEEDARRLYKEAQTVDEWAGESYSGTSVLAGAKIVQRGGYMPEYRWAFGLADLILAVGYKGPAVLGIPWYDGMFRTDADGWVHVAGSVAGGHAILCQSVSVRERCFWLVNSWGTSWGVGGRCRISFDDLERLLHEQGEACVPVHRARPL